MTFFSNALNGIGYVRCQLPARALNAGIVEFDAWVAGKTTPEECWAGFDGPGVFQLVANWARLHAMRDYRRITGQPVLVEVDDDYVGWHQGYVRGQVELQPQITVGTGWVEQDVPEWGHPAISSPVVHRRALREADGVIVSTPWLAAVVRPLNPDVFVCRNCVDPDDWPARAPDDGVFRVVFSASPNARDLALIRPAMEWAAKQPGVEAWVVGYKPRWRGVRELGWVESVPEYRRVMAELRPDVWLRPIETTLFAKAKSDLKILEAAMVGALPIVTPYDPYLGWRETPVRFASTPKDWQQQVRWATRHRDQVRVDAAAVREIVLQTRGLESAAREWGRAFASQKIALAA